MATGSGRGIAPRRATTARTAIPLRSIDAATSSRQRATCPGLSAESCGSVSTCATATSTRYFTAASHGTTASVVAAFPEPIAIVDHLGGRCEVDTSRCGAEAHHDHPYTKSGATITSRTDLFNQPVRTRNA
jgi:hypothetical protein